MNTQSTPRAWAKICAQALIPAALGVIAMTYLIAITTITSVIPDPTGYAISIFAYLTTVFGIFVFLESGADEMWAFITGNTVKQASHARAWRETKQSYVKAYQRVRGVFRSDNPAYLRELGAIGVNLVTHTRKQQSAGRQSGHRKAGGHKKPASSSDDGDGDGGSEPPASLPLILTVHDLASLLQVSPKTLQNKPKSTLPVAVFIPACRGKGGVQ